MFVGEIHQFLLPHAALFGLPGQMAGLAKHVLGEGMNAKKQNLSRYCPEYDEYYVIIHFIHEISEHV